MRAINYIICICLLLCVGVGESFAQTNEGKFVTYSGVVKDRKGGKPIESATVTVSNGPIATVTNSEGAFTLKVPLSYDPNQIKITHLGYYNYIETVNGNDLLDLDIRLIRYDLELPEVNVVSGDAIELIKEVIKKIPQNYSTTDNQMLGFYRETVQKRRKYINISEAIVDTYKSDYSHNVDKDRVRIVKGRKLLSENAKDTLAVKLLGGPTLSVYMDLAKNPNLLFDEELLNYYNFRYAGMATINDRMNYEITFSPSHILPYALYIGKLYIDLETLGVTRAEFELDMSDKDKATSDILRKKPFGLRFKPEELSFVVSYMYRDGIFYYHYARNKIQFKCDWKRRLFATNYTIVSEVATTDVKEEDLTKINRKEAFRNTQVFSDKVYSFLDPNFWEDYNIIEPTESLESGVKKLRKQYE